MPRFRRCSQSSFLRIISSTMHLLLDAFEVNQDLSLEIILKLSWRDLLVLGNIRLLVIISCQQIQYCVFIETCCCNEGKNRLPLTPALQINVGLVTHYNSWTVWSGMLKALISNFIGDRRSKRCFERCDSDSQ